MKITHDNLVHQARLFIESSPLMVFALARVYAHLPATRQATEAEMLSWKKTGKYPRHVEDFCLDLLSKRVGLWVVLPKKELTDGKA